MNETFPNILLIHCHDLGQYLGCYGRDIETPNIDAIAENGALFENHYVTAPQCSPSRSSLMTGRYPHSNGLMGLAHDEWKLHADEITLPEYLNKYGYETHLFGLQHLTETPGRLGYDCIHSNENLSPEVSPSNQAVNRAVNIAEKLENFLENNSFQPPLFLSVGVFETHRLRVDDQQYGFTDEIYESANPAAIDLPAFLPDKPAIREDLANMHGMVSALDTAVGKIIDALNSSSIAQETFVVFTTEHGISFPRAKGSCYDPGIEAALLLQYPGVIDSGVRYDEFISNVDLVPTFLELLDKPIPKQIQGRSFFRLLTNGEYSPRNQLFSEMTWHDQYNPVRAIRTPKYKYIRCFWHLPSVYLPDDIILSKSGRELSDLHAGRRPYEQLYDITNDPLEKVNLANDSEYTPICNHLQERLNHWMKKTEDPLLDGPVLPSDYEKITRV